MSSIHCQSVMPVQTTTAGRRLLSCLTLFLLAGIPVNADAQAPQSPTVLNPQTDSASLQESLRAMSEKIKKEEGRLKDIRVRENEISNQLKASEGKLAEVGKQRESLTASLAEIAKKREVIEQRIGSAKQEVLGAEQIFRARIRAMYKMRRRVSAASFVLQADSATDFLKRAHFLERLARTDREFSVKLGSLLERLENDNAKLLQLAQEQEAAIAETNRLGKQLEDTKVQVASLLREERQKKTQAETAVGRLRASAKSLEEVLENLTGIEETPPQEVAVVTVTPPAVETPTHVPTPSIVPTPSPTVKAQPTVAAVRPTVVIAQPSPAPKSGNFGALKGQLPFPVSGQLVQRYGKQRHEEFSDMLFVKGLEVIAPVGSSVKAVADGTVAVTRELPGFGKVVIVDHGQRFYTLYGRLAKWTVAVGETVTSGGAVGEVGTPDHRKRNFYFELRVKGKATDPTVYFKQLPPAAG